MAELVEGARLESGYMGNCVVGSNPTLSAIKEYLKRVGFEQKMRPMEVFSGQAVGIDKPT